ncbi:MAG: hypothetical protein ACI9H6_000016 [Patiriisocius sp.]|jgi:hypothetical protein
MLTGVEEVYVSCAIHRFLVGMSELDDLIVVPAVFASLSVRSDLMSVRKRFPDISLEILKT